MIICRCEEITEEEIISAIHDGATTVDDVKRYVHAGTGLCQGKTCGKLISCILARELSIQPPESGNPRPPVRPVRIGDFLNIPEGDLEE